MYKYTTTPNSLKDLSPPSHLLKNSLAYLDQVRVWLPRRLDDKQVKQLMRLCGKIHLNYEPMPYHPRWRQRINLFQPTAEAFDYLDKITKGNHFINYVELALDLITDNPKELEEYLLLHLFKRWHKTQNVVMNCDIHYYAQRKATNNIILYADRPSKKNGEACVHMEWRTNTAAGVRKHKIDNLIDLLEFDHRAFWQKNLQLRALDYAKLGRMVRPTKRRTAWIKTPSFGKPFDEHERIGKVISRNRTKYDKEGNPILPMGAVQSLVNNCDFNVLPALNRIEIEWLLPERAALIQ